MGGVVSMQYMDMEGVSKSCGVVGRTKKCKYLLFPTFVSLTCDFRHRLLGLFVSVTFLNVC